MGNGTPGKMEPEDVRSRKALAAIRRVKAVNLRAAGATYDAIGRSLDVTAQAAFSLVRVALRNLSKEETIGAKPLRAMELRKIDSLLAGLWNDLYETKTITKDGETSTKTTDVIKPKIARLILECISQRRALLGLDPPKEIDLRTYHSIESVYKEIDKEHATAIAVQPGSENGGNGRVFPPPRT